MRLLTLIWPVLVHVFVETTVTPFFLLLLFAIFSVSDLALVAFSWLLLWCPLDVNWFLLMVLFVSFFFFNLCVVELRFVNWYLVCLYVWTPLLLIGKEFPISKGEWKLLGWDFSSGRWLWETIWRLPSLRLHVVHVKYVSALAENSPGAALQTVPAHTGSVEIWKMPIFFFAPQRKKFVVFLGDDASGKTDSGKQEGGFCLATRRTERGWDILPSWTRL